IALRGGTAGFFEGEVDIQGDVFADFVGATHVDATTVNANMKSFRIDHPLDPKNKFLVHASVESSEMKTFYDGVVTLDRSGKATVRLPKWFEALNKDFRYQLTPVGAPGPNLHIAEGVTRNRFKIAGGAPSMKVCWQVIGIRQDKFAKDHPLSVEQHKRREDMRVHGLRDRSRRSTEGSRRFKRKRKRSCQRTAKEWRSCGRPFKRKSNPSENPRSEDPRES